MNALLKRAAGFAWALAAAAGLAAAQRGASMESAPAAAPSAPQNSSTNPFLGSVATGQATQDMLQLSLADAIQRGLKQNLGALLRGDQEAELKGNLTLARSPL